jgi:hypothetical protein
MKKHQKKVKKNDISHIYAHNFVYDRNIRWRRMNPIILFMILVFTYIVMGVNVLSYLLQTRFLRPLTNKEMLKVILTWPKWL